MAANRSSFDKLQRDRDKKAKAAAKREKRLDKTTGLEEDDSAESPDEGAEPLQSTDEVLRLVAAVHEQFDAGQISYEDFEERKTALLSRLTVE